MFWKKDGKLDRPTETLGGDAYYRIDAADVARYDDVDVTFAGTLSAKPLVEFYAAGWPWSLSSRLIEEDHGHLTTLTVDGVTVFCKGPLFLTKGEPVTVWGKLKGGAVTARRVESDGVIYQA